MTAQQTSLSWTLVPHVTQHDLADVTELETFRKQHPGEAELTVTAFALKAAAIALKEYPQVNSSLDQAAGQLVLKGYYHIGVAVDTERGLLVPVVRDVDSKSIFELAEELAGAAERARQGKAEMRGGTFTITPGRHRRHGVHADRELSRGSHPGSVAFRWEPVVREGQVTPRLMLPLSLSYDHRVVDALRRRFLRRLASLLENPLLMLLYA